MKKIVLVLLLLCNVLIAMSCDTDDNNQYEMASYVVDSVSINITNKQWGYIVELTINESKMRCHLSNVMADKSERRDISLADSVEIYSGISDFIIEGSKSKFDYISERPDPDDRTPISMQEDYVARIYTELYINGAVFVNYFYIGDIYSGKEQGVVEWMVIHSEPFRRFMQKFERHVIGKMGKDTIKRYKTMITNIKQKYPEDILI